MKMLNGVYRNLAILCFVPMSAVFAETIEILDKNNEIVEIEFYEPVNSSIFGEVSRTAYTLDEVDTMLVSGDYMNRALAAAVLADARIAKVTKCVEMLVTELDKELQRPFSYDMAVEFSAPITEFLLGQYLHDLRYLLYSNDPRLLKPYIQKSEGELKSMLILAAGLLGDKDVRNDIRNIYLENERGFIRFQAIQVMNIFPDMQDLSVLRQALSDDYHTIDRFGNEMWPIRTTSRGALIKLGFSISEIEKMRNGEK
jgi:hypothetical protein